MMDEFYAESDHVLNHARATEAFSSLLADERLGYVGLIQADHEDVGYVVIILCHSMEYAGSIAFVDDLFVRLPFRRNGLGTAALSAVRALCAQRGIRAIHVETGEDNPAAQALYGKAGFKPTDRLLLALTLEKPTHED